jgi:hypothetical protein
MTQIEFNWIAVIGMLIGWAFNLGILWQMSRNHKEMLVKHEEEIDRLKARVDDHHEKAEIHTSVEWRTELREWMGKLDVRLETIQKQCLERVLKGVC